MISLKYVNTNSRWLMKNVCPMFTFLGKGMNAGLFRLRTTVKKVHSPAGKGPLKSLIIC